MKTIFNLDHLEGYMLDELIENPSVYSKLLKAIILHYYYKSEEYAPDGTDFEYDEEDFKFIVQR